MTNENEQNIVINIRISKLTLKTCIPLEDSRYLIKYSNSQISTNEKYHNQFIQSEIDRIKNNELFPLAIESEEPIECEDNNNNSDCAAVAEALGAVLSLKVECEDVL